jgi:hypothetical protein
MPKLNPFYALENLLRIELEIGVAKLLQNKSLR